MPATTGDYADPARPFTHPPNTSRPNIGITATSALAPHRHRSAQPGRETRCRASSSTVRGSHGQYRVDVVGAARLRHLQLDPGDHRHRRPTRPGPPDRRPDAPGTVQHPGPRHPHQPGTDPATPTRRRAADRRPHQAAKPADHPRRITTHNDTAHPRQHHQERNPAPRPDSRNTSTPTTRSTTTNRANQTSRRNAQTTHLTTHGFGSEVTTPPRMATMAPR